ncbi:MAG: DUF1566 domain-containing protein [bacterium]|nr:DUF1566 domain-containing protein [bacterium]
MPRYALLLPLLFLGSCALLPRPCLIASPCPCENTYRILDEASGRLITVFQSPHFDQLFDSCACKRRLHPTGIRVTFLSQGEISEACKATAEIRTGFYRPVLGQEAITILRNAAGELGANAVSLEYYEPGNESIGRAYRCDEKFLAGIEDETLNRNRRRSDPNSPSGAENLVWQECSYGQAAGRPCGGKALSFEWSAAEQYCLDLRLDGRAWRLPSREELRRIVDARVPEGRARIDAREFPNTRRHVYWTSTPYARDPNVYWVVDFDTGADYGYAHENPGFVRCVADIAPRGNNP